MDDKEIKEKLLELTQQEQDLYNLKFVKGYNVAETLKKLNISRYKYDKIIAVFKEKGLYDKDKMEHAKINKQKRDRAALLSEHPELRLSSEEENYRKQCVDYMSVNFLDYDPKIQNFNPILIDKLRALHKVCSYKIILYAMKSQYGNMKRALEYKKFNNDRNKISYLIAIIRNSLNISWKKMIMEEKAYNNYKKNLNLDQFMERVNNTQKSKPTKRIDMSEWLD